MIVDDFIERRLLTASDGCGWCVAIAGIGGLRSGIGILLDLLLVHRRAVRTSALRRHRLLSKLRLLLLLNWRRAVGTATLRRRG